MLVRNTTHYYTIGTKEYFSVPDSNSFAFESSRRMGFYQRLYFEYLYTQKVKGQAFFYTLTYNDSAIPKYYDFDKPCFDYNDIRLVTNGKLSKDLKRLYGSRLRYFCACERGEGKGKRGFGYNPHYHFIFFVQPLHDSAGIPVYDCYKPISCFQFRDIVRTIWQGSTGYVDFKKARFGIAREGDFCGLIQSPDAFSYVGKYCCKDSSERDFESSVRKYWYSKCVNDGITSKVISEFVLYESCGSDDKISEIYYWLDYNAFLRSDCTTYWQFVQRYCLSVTKNGKTSPSKWIQIRDAVNNFYKDIYIPNFVDTKVREYRNFYSSKVRLSKGLGEYGLQFIRDLENNPHFVVNDSSNFKCQTPTLFYIRKLYYNVETSANLNPIYVLNDLGKQYKLNSLNSNIDSLLYRTSQNLSYVSSTPVYIEGYKDPSTLVRVLLHLPDLPYLLRSYAVYSLVYKFRSFDPSDFNLSLTDELLDSDVLFDYSRYLDSNYYSLDFDLGTISSFIAKDRCYLSTSTLQPFNRYIKWFKFIDAINEFIRDYTDSCKRSLFLDKCNHMKRINQYKYTLECICS